MHYIIYKITNLINDKIYIGKHKTLDIDDGYMGSGNLIKRAINKYGVENFKKDILYELHNEIEMNEKEIEIVNEEFIRLNSNYNLMSGGQGGNTLSSYSPEELINSNIKKSKAVSLIWKNLTNEDKNKRNKKGQNNTDQQSKGEKISKWRKDFFAQETEEDKIKRVKKARIGSLNVKKIQCEFCLKNFDPGNFTKHKGVCRFDPDSINYGKFRVKKIYVILSPNDEIIEIDGNFRKVCAGLGISAHILKKNIGCAVKKLSVHTSNTNEKSLNTIGWKLVEIKEEKY